MRGREGASIVVDFRAAALNDFARRLRLLGWLEAGPRYRESLEAQRRRGRRLERRLIDPALDARDRSLFAHHRMSRCGLAATFKFPLPLAFGYELGRVLTRPRHGCTLLPAAETCAAFNAGIALFDRVCDGGGVASRELAHTLNDATLRGVMQGSIPDAHLMQAARGARAIEVRVLLRIVWLVFSRLRCRSSDASDGQRQRLFGLLLEAYRAEMETLAGAAVPSRIGKLAAAVRRKSILPFRIIGAIARLYDGAACDERDAVDESLADELGHTFALIDDLADIADDFRMGAANALLLRAGATSWPFAGLTRAFQEEVNDEIITRVRQVLDLIHRSHAASNAARFEQALLTYIQSWLVPGATTDHHRSGAVLALQDEFQGERGS